MPLAYSDDGDVDRLMDGPSTTLTVPENDATRASPDSVRVNDTAYALPAATPVSIAAVPFATTPQPGVHDQLSENGVDDDTGVRLGSDTTGVSTGSADDSTSDAPVARPLTVVCSAACTIVNVVSAHW